MNHCNVAFSDTSSYIMLHVQEIKAVESRGPTLHVRPRGWVIEKDFHFPVDTAVDIDGMFTMKYDIFKQASKCITKGVDFV